MDKESYADFRLSRNNCTYINNAYVKDLSKLGRDLKNIIIIDNSPIAYSLQKENGIPIPSWTDDSTDIELKKLIPVLFALSHCNDVRKFIKSIVVNDQVNYSLAMNIISKNKFLQNDSIKMASEYSRKISEENCKTFENNWHNKTNEFKITNTNLNPTFSNVPLLHSIQPKDYILNNKEKSNYENLSEVNKSIIHRKAINNCSLLT